MSTRDLTNTDRGGQKRYGKGADHRFCSHQGFAAPVYRSLAAPIHPLHRKDVTRQAQHALACSNPKPTLSGEPDTNCLRAAFSICANVRARQSSLRSQRRLPPIGSVPCFPQSVSWECTRASNARETVKTFRRSRRARLTLSGRNSNKETRQSQRATVCVPPKW